jgi:hypothetical protein
VISHVDKQECQPKQLGMYLVEAALITQYELDAALKEQQQSGKKLGKILVMHGLLKQETIEYFMANFVIPERQKSLKQVSNYGINQDEHLCATCEPVFANNVEDAIATRRSHNLELPISAHQIFKFLLCVVFCLAFLSLLANFSVYYMPDLPGNYSLRKIFDLNTEENIPSLYSTATLLFCSLLLATIAQAYKLAKNSSFRSWMGMSIVFAFLAVDEYISIHEQLTKPLRNIFNTSGLFFYAWVIVGAIFVVIFLLVFGKFVLSLPASIKRLFFIAGLIYVTGAIGIEMIGGSYNEQNSIYNISYIWLATIEEVFEMIGVAIFIYALLMYMSRYMKGVTMKLNILDSRKQAQNY